jgi:hypothetical protein
MVVFGLIISTLLIGPSVLSQDQAQSTRTNRQTDMTKLANSRFS